jgi:hypothetical protein
MKYSLSISIAVFLLICSTEAALFNTDICARNTPQVMEKFNITKVNYNKKFKN